MKLESLVIVNQHVTVNMFLGLVLTARQVMEAGGTRSPTTKWAQGKTSDWD